MVRGKGLFDKDRRHGRENDEVVQKFSMTMHNLGLSRAAEELLDMLKSQGWQRWSQGGMTFEFLPGEFDYYFLSQQDIQRSEVMAIPDIDAKAKLEEAMDERRTGEPDYRRQIADARAALPELLPYGHTRKEAEVILEGDGKPTQRPPLGSTLRHYRNSGGKEARRPDKRARWKCLAASARRLPDDELVELQKLIDEERERRRTEAAA